MRRSHGGGHIDVRDRIDRGRSGDCRGSRLADGNRNLGETFWKTEVD